MNSASPILRIGVVCIGDELLKGFTINTNLSDIGRELLLNGYIIDSASVIKDNKNSIKEAVKNFIEKGMDIVIMTGGLGPTVDDITKKTVADFLGKGFVRNEIVVEQLKKYWAKRESKMPETVLNQALVPEGSTFFPNEVGTAPGIKIPLDNSTSDIPCVILLPGPPREINPMLRKYVIPFINSIDGIGKNYTETLYVVGIPESVVEGLTFPCIENSDLGVAYCASPEAVKIYISGSDIERVRNKAEEIRELLGDQILPVGIKSPIEELINHCLENQITISTAESCTGGMISSAITDIPGASAIYRGSIISYSNEWKKKLLGVSNQTIEKFGAVSRECADEMVTNLCDKYGSDSGISVTGIAGPGGGSDEKPVGLVFIGAKYKDKKIVEKYIFPGDRKSIRVRTLSTACLLLRSLLK